MKHTTILLIAFFIVLFNSCSNEELNAIDTNPNSPETVSVNLLLPQVTMNTVAAMSGSSAHVAMSYFTEHSADTEFNIIEPIRGTELLWQATYTGLLNLQTLINQAEEQELKNYSGIARVLFAYTLATATDTWGNIPYTEALQGSEGRTPKFDEQELIYNELQVILDQAIADLSANSPEDTAAFDLLLDGNIDLWIKTAYGLKARYYNRLSNIDSEQSAMDALSSVQNSFSSVEENCIFSKYGVLLPTGNPWKVKDLGLGSLGLSSTFYNIIQQFGSDPREDILFTKIDGAIVPAPIGENTSDPGHTKYSAAVLAFEDVQPIITYDEIKFIEAEANLRLDNAAAANTAYEAAVSAAMTRVGVAAEDIADYTAQETVFPGQASLTLDDILSQKFISFYLKQPLEAFNDQRRTGIPAKQNPDPDGNPLRMLYPNIELSNNENAEAQGINLATIYTQKLWWAK